MNPNREELLFQLALTKPAAERAAWLDRECGDDKALRQRLDARHWRFGIRTGVRDRPGQSREIVSLAMTTRKDLL